MLLYISSFKTKLKLKLKINPESSVYLCDALGNSSYLNIRVAQILVIRKIKIVALNAFNVKNN